MELLAVVELRGLLGLRGLRGLPERPVFEGEDPLLRLVLGEVFCGDCGTSSGVGGSDGIASVELTINKKTY